MKPAFIGPIYGSMERVAIPADAPPMFAVTVRRSAVHEERLRADRCVAGSGPPRGIPCTKGGHGFGLGKEGTTSPGWFDAFVRWLDVSGFLQPDG